VARQTPLGARPNVGRPARSMSPGGPHRWMATQSRKGWTEPRLQADSPSSPAGSRERAGRSTFRYDRSRPFATVCHLLLWCRCGAATRGLARAPPPPIWPGAPDQTAPKRHQASSCSRATARHSSRGPGNAGRCPSPARLGSWRPGSNSPAAVVDVGLERTRSRSADSVRSRSRATCRTLLPLSRTSSTVCALTPVRTLTHPSLRRLTPEGLLTSSLRRSASCRVSVRPGPLQRD